MKRLILVAAWPVLTLLAVWMAGVATRLWLRDFTDIAGSSSYVFGPAGLDRRLAAIGWIVQGAFGLIALVSVGCTLVASAAAQMFPGYSRVRCVNIGLSAWPGVLTIVLANCVAWALPIALAIGAAESGQAGMAVGAAVIGGLIWFGMAEFSLWPARLAERPTVWGVRLVLELRRITIWRHVARPAAIALFAGVNAAVFCWLKLEFSRECGVWHNAPVLLPAGILLWIAARAVLPMRARAYVAGRERLHAGSIRPMAVAHLDGEAAVALPQASMHSGRRPWVGFALFGVLPAVAVAFGAASAMWWMTPPRIDHEWFERIAAAQPPVESAGYEQLLADIGTTMVEDEDAIRREAITPLVVRRCAQLRPRLEQLAGRWQEMAVRRVGYHRSATGDADFMQGFSAVRAFNTARAVNAATADEFIAVTRDAFGMARAGLSTGVLIDELVHTVHITEAFQNLCFWLPRMRGQLTLADFGRLDDLLCEAALPADTRQRTLEREALWLYRSHLAGRPLYDDAGAAATLDLDLPLPTNDLMMAHVLHALTGAPLNQTPPQVGRFHEVVQACVYDVLPTTESATLILLWRTLLRIEAHRMLTGAVPASVAAISDPAWNLPQTGERFARDTAMSLVSTPADLTWAGPGEFEGRVENVSGAWWSRSISVPPGTSPQAALQVARDSGGALFPEIAEPDWTGCQPIVWPAGPVSVLQVLDMLATALNALLLPDDNHPSGDTLRFHPDTGRSLRPWPPQPHPFRAHIEIMDASGRYTVVMED